jgi:phage terminase large subunit
MAATEKTKLLNEIETKIQSLNLLQSTIKADRSRKPETIEVYRKQYYEMLSPKGKNGK